MTVRVHLLVPGQTPAARRGVLGADDSLDESDRALVLRRVRPWPDSPVATCAPDRACVETAALLGVHAVVDPAVRDWDLGAWTGRSLTEIATTSPKELEPWLGDPDFAGHGGESLHQLRSRITHWLDRLENQDQRRLMTVASTAVVRAVLVSVLDAPTATFWRLDLEPMTSVHVSLRPGRRAIRWSAD